MEKKMIAVAAVVGLLGLLSAVLAFAAEATRIKVSDVQTKTPGECVYPSSPALVLGLLAAAALTLAQAIINTLAGCICCKRHLYSSHTNWTLALVSFIVSWVVYVLAFLLLLTGAALNEKGHERTYFGGYCYVVKPGVFSGGAVLSVASVSLAIVYYVALSSPKNVHSSGIQQNQGIVMGQVQIPPQSATPVFVHEDTYNRQQFP